MKPERMGGGEAGPDPSGVRVGKDMLELVSSAMYVDPLVVYREYVQNAADAIGEARAAGLLAPGEPGMVEIGIDEQARSVRIRDNGAALPPELFGQRMLALGGSAKRGTGARGFRGVGRLAGLGFAQELVFRSRAPGQEHVNEVVWDGRRLKAALLDPTLEGVADLIAAVAKQASVAAAPDEPARFFEVELRRIARSKGDRLLDRDAAADYLSQVAPVPFSPEFSHGAEIAAAIRAATALDELDITVNGGDRLTRPHRDAIPLGNARSSAVVGVSHLEIPGSEGGLAAVAWFAHHGYEGAIPSASLVKGVRLRVGNLQVGGHAMLDDIFPETRFNSWAVGEVHVLDPRIVPNGRRDEFERNGHLANLVNHLSPVARDIARRCRTSSARRSRLRSLESACREAEERVEVIEQGGLSQAAREAEAIKAEAALATMERLSGPDLLEAVETAELRAAAGEVRSRLAAAIGVDGARDPLDALPTDEQARYREMINLIYECSANRVAAKALVDRIMTKVVTGLTSAPGEAVVGATARARD